MPDETNPRAVLMAAIVAALGEMGGTVANDSINPHFKSRYTSLGALREFTGPILAKHGLALLHELLPPPAESETPGVMIRSHFVHVSGESLTLGPMFFPCLERTAQAVKGACTYGMRCCEIAALHLGSVDDDDGTAASKPPIRSAIVPGKESKV